MAYFAAQTTFWISADMEVAASTEEADSEFQAPPNAYLCRESYRKIFAGPLNQILKSLGSHKRDFAAYFADQSMEEADAF